MNKLPSAMLAGSATSIVIWILDAFCHITIPGDVASSFTMFISILVHQLVPEIDKETLPSPTEDTIQESKKS